MWFVISAGVVELCRRSPPLWPWIFSTHQLVMPPTNVSSAERWYSWSSVLYRSIFGGDDTFWLCINIDLTAATNDATATMMGILVSSCPINQHIPSNVSSAERWHLRRFLLYLPSSFPSFDLWGSGSDVVCASTSPPIEDWGECTIGGMGRDRKVLLLIVRLYLTPTSLHLYTAWQGYNHRRNMMYNLCISYKR